MQANEQPPPQSQPRPAPKNFNHQIEVHHLWSSFLPQDGDCPAFPEVYLCYTGFEYAIDAWGPFQVPAWNSSNPPNFTANQAELVERDVYTVAGALAELMQCFSRLRDGPVQINDDDFGDLVDALIRYRSSSASLRQHMGANKFCGWAFNVRVPSEDNMSDRTFQIVKTVTERIFDLGLESHW